MARPISPQQFHEAEGVEDWRVVFEGACAHFRTGTFATGIALVNALSDAIEQPAAGQHPDVDLRADSVTVRLGGEGGSLTDEDAVLAAKISTAARALGVPADPSAVQTIQLAIDAMVGPEVMPFWRAVLDYRERGDEDLEDPRGRGPSLWFQVMDAPRPQRNRIHVDVSVPHDVAEARVAAGLAAGGRLVSAHAPQYWTLADSEGNEVDIATWQGR